MKSNIKQFRKNKRLEEVYCSYCMKCTTFKAFNTQEGYLELVCCGCKGSSITRLKKAEK